MKRNPWGIQKFFILALILTFGVTITGGAGASAEAVAAKTTLFPSKSSFVQPFSPEVPVIAFKDSTSRALSVLEVENALRIFLASVPSSLSSQEKAAVRETLSTLLNSGHRQQTLQHAIQNGLPIELISLVPDKASESMAVQEFSQAFRFPLQFESGVQISPTAVSIFVEKNRVLIEIRSEHSNRTFSVRPR